MPTLLVKNISHLFTMQRDAIKGEESEFELQDAALFCRDGIIEQVGRTSDLPNQADEILDLSGHVVIPGLINTHHHLYQNLTRVVPGAQDAPLFGWLQTLYPIWGKLGSDHIFSSARVGLAELALSGCTTSSDHLYLFPNDARLDDEIRAAQDIGLRFHATRGSMSIGESSGGLPPDDLVEDEESILEDCVRVIEAHHDPTPFAMTRIALAPCSPFSVSQKLMLDSAEMARKFGVGLHTHLAENVEDINYSQEKFGMRPGEYIQSLGWTGSDVWHAHCVQLDASEIELFAATKTGIAHCPCSNMRLASGIAPVREMIDADVRVGLGVDGSASNDSAHLLSEARQALLLQRVLKGAAALTAREALRLATIGGADVLNRDDIGSLQVGKAADFAAFRTDQLNMAGCSWDPVSALIFCGPFNSAYTVVQGKQVVAEGQLVNQDLSELLDYHRQLTIDLIDS